MLSIYVYFIFGQDLPKLYFKLDQTHRLWFSSNGQSLPIQPRKDGKAKIYQVQQFIKCEQEEK